MLLNDTYMNYNYPEIGKAAVALLEAAGFKVELADAPCCGRPMISKGMMDAAKANARHNVGTAARLRGKRSAHHRLRAELPADAAGRVPAARALASSPAPWRARRS